MRPAMRPLLALSIFVAATAAAAERPRVAVLEVAIGGDAPPALRTQVEKSLEGGLYAAGFEVVPSREVAARLRRARSLAGCTSTTCLARIGDLVGARRFVRARVAASGGAYDVELELLAPDVEGGVVQRVERTCAVCTLREANDLVSRSVVELVNPPRPEAPPPVKVAVRTSPEGATVSVDGTLVGRAPVELELEPGEHNFEATGPEGYAPLARRETVGGERADVHLELPRVAPPPPAAPPPRASRFGAWKWAAAGGAVAALAAGVALVALDGKGTDCSAGRPCKSEYTTLAPGLVAGGVGVGLGALAAWMFLSDAPVVVAPERGGVAVVVRGRF